MDGQTSDRCDKPRSHHINRTGLNSSSDHAQTTLTVHVARSGVIIIIIIIIIIIMQRLTRRVSVIRMTNRRRGGHVDLRITVSVIKRFEFLFESVCSDVQVASDDVR